MAVTGGHMKNRKEVELGDLRAEYLRGFKRRRKILFQTLMNTTLITSTSWLKIWITPCTKPCWGSRRFLYLSFNYTSSHETTGKSNSVEFRPRRQERWAICAQLLQNNTSIGERDCVCTRIWQQPEIKIILSILSFSRLLKWFRTQPLLMSPTDYNFHLFVSIPFTLH